MISRRAFLTGASSAAIAAALPAAKAAPVMVGMDFGVEHGGGFLVPREFGRVFYESTAGDSEGWVFRAFNDLPGPASEVTFDNLRAMWDRLTDRDPNPPRPLLTAEEMARPIPMLEETLTGDAMAEKMRRFKAAIFEEAASGRHRGWSTVGNVGNGSNA